MIEPSPLHRRNLLQCGAWLGSGVVWTLARGALAGGLLDGQAPAAQTARGLSFVQISDTHIGFKKPANPDPVGTLKQTLAHIRALPRRPDFVLHTGDVTHLASPEQFDLAQSLLSELGVPVVFTPGEHDIADGVDPRPFLARFGKGALGEGWRSFDIGGAHFVGLVNAVRLGEGGQGTLGEAQLAWLKSDLAPLRASTPVVVYAHFPLWGLYPQWGWGTQDGEQALALLRRFGSVTVLNGHVHQVQQKIEGTVTFHTARSTAYPQPAPGEGAGPGPLLVAPEDLPKRIGLTSVTRRPGLAPLALVDATLAAA